MVAQGGSRQRWERWRRWCGWWCRVGCNDGTVQHATINRFAIRGSARAVRPIGLEAARRKTTGESASPRRFFQTRHAPALQHALAWQRATRHRPRIVLRVHGAILGAGQIEERMERVTAEKNSPHR